MPAIPVDRLRDLATRIFVAAGTPRDLAEDSCRVRAIAYSKLASWSDGSNSPV